MGTAASGIKVLVTGGGGFAGLALVRRLKAAGYEVTSFSRNLCPEHAREGINFIQGDITDPAEVEKGCRGMEAVFHLAAKVGLWGSYDDFYRVNVTGTRNVISACLKNNISRLLFVSSASVVFDGRDMEGADESSPYPFAPLSPYTATKALAEQLVLRACQENLKTVALRPHLIWGPGDTQLIPGIIRRGKRGVMWLPGKKKHLIDTVYIDNFIDAILLAFHKMNENPAVCGKAFFITNNEPIPVGEFINSILRSAGYPAVTKSIPEWMARMTALGLETIYRVLHLKNEPPLTLFLVSELCTHHWFDISAAKTMLGYEPAVSIKEGFRRLESYSGPLHPH